MYPLLQTDRTPDNRYTVALEWCGQPEQKHVVRFCTDWVGYGDTFNAAARLAYSHDAERMGVSRPRDLINLEAQVMRFFDRLSKQTPQAQRDANFAKHRREKAKLKKHLKAVKTQKDGKK